MAFLLSSAGRLDEPREPCIVCSVGVAVAFKNCAEAGGTNAASLMTQTAKNAAEDSHEHSHAATSPLLWMGITVGVLLLLNLTVLLFRRRKSSLAQTDEPAPDETGKEAATKIA